MNMQLDYQSRHRHLVVSFSVYIIRDNSKQ